MTEGTRSLLIGCHNFIMHPIQVIRGHKGWFGKWPDWRRIVCIFLHDVGLFGRQYLSDNQAKHGHWELGAKIAKRLFGQWGYDYCAGHTPESKLKRSELWYADKYSWVVAPLWWMDLNYKYDVADNGRRVSDPWKFKLWVAKNIKQDLLTGNYFGAHQLYLSETNGKQSCPANS